MEEPRTNKPAKLLRPFEVIDYLSKFQKFSRLKLHYYKKVGALVPIASIYHAGHEMGLYSEAQLLEFLEKQQKLKDIEKAFGYVPRKIKQDIFINNYVDVSSLSQIKKHPPSWIERKKNRRKGLVNDSNI